MKLTISRETTAKWQRIVDLIARVADVPESLVMRTYEPHHSVFATSKTEGNPYELAAALP